MQKCDWRVFLMVITRFKTVSPGTWGEVGGGVESAVQKITFFSSERSDPILM